MLDYTECKRRFAQHLADDLEGTGRIESAAYHTVEWAYLQGVAEHQELIKRIVILETAMIGVADRIDEHIYISRAVFSAQLRETANDWQPPQMDPAFTPKSTY